VVAHRGVYGAAEGFPHALPFEKAPGHVVQGVAEVTHFVGGEHGKGLLVITGAHPGGEMFHLHEGRGGGPGQEKGEKKTNHQSQGRERHGRGGPGGRRVFSKQTKVIKRENKKWVGHGGQKKEDETPLKGNGLDPLHRYG
jgi:hypothetical protein